MNKKVLTTLEFDKVIEKLTEKCQTPLGKKRAAALVPLTEIEEIEQNQAETADAISRVFSHGSVSCSGARDIRDSLHRLRVQGTLSQIELLNIGAVLKTALRVKTYGGKMDPDQTDSLAVYFDALQPLSALQKEIDRCIISEEEIADDASPALKAIRRKKMAAAARVHSELNAFVSKNSAYLRDTLVTMRNGRFVVPVKNECRNMIPGLVQDESGSGSTVFIEPMIVVKINNELRQLEIEETKEIEVILASLSSLAADYTDELKTDLQTLSHLDFVFAKAALARDMDASRPSFNKERYINIKSGRHPLLDKHTVVPVDVWLGKDFHELIVTGPNTGGKTVSLKTVGLFCLMGQAGLHIPAFEGSSLGVFTEIYADIGDEQSIEQSLSTFSSHMKNIVYIIRHADMDSLVLLDELCSGTDPTEGAALAISILKFLGRMEVRTMATTHYSELKIYALSTDRVENASCEFNVATLSPTYRLLIGIPGKSNAFAISKKLGLPGYIIDEAKTQIDESDERFEDVIKRLHDTRQTIEKEKMQVNTLKAEAKVLKDSVSRQEARMEEQKEKILKEAREEARKLLAEAKAQVDETIRLVNKTGSADVKELEKTRQKTRELMEKTAEKEVKAEPAARSKTKAKDLHIGDGVRVLSMGLTGTVSSLPDAKGNLFVQMGILRSQVNLSDVVLTEDNTVSVNGRNITKSGASSYAGLSKAMTISAEINLIGKTVDEALTELDKYLDDAYLSHLPQVRIVHGKGSGALRAAVHNKLRRLNYIKEYRLGEYGEGDAGVTIAVFK